MTFQYETRPADWPMQEGCTFVHIEGDVAVCCWEPEGAAAWIANHSGLTLADLIARRPDAPKAVYVKAGHERIGRIPRRRWPLYDAWPISMTIEGLVKARSREAERVAEGSGRVLQGLVVIHIEYKHWDQDWVTERPDEDETKQGKAGESA